MYSQVLLECAHVRGWEVHLLHARDVEAQAARSQGQASRRRAPPRATVGPLDRLTAWTKDLRIALATTIVAS